MAERRTTTTPKRSAWIVTYDAPRAPREAERYGGVEPGMPLAVLPSRSSRQVIRAVVDAFAQNMLASPVDSLDYLKTGHAPYAAKDEGWGWEVEGGYNPRVVAFQVRDLQVVTDHNTGESHYRFSREKPSPPQWLLDRRAEGSL